MKAYHRFLQSVTIAASPAAVDYCFTDLAAMHRWLNPALRCEPIGNWSTQPGAQSRFTIEIPLWRPTLTSTVIQRSPHLIIWQFEGFFQGQDQWQWQATGKGTQLTNQFEFTISQPIVEFGFNHLASHWTRKDMAAQLQRLKQIAEHQSLTVS